MAESENEPPGVPRNVAAIGKQIRALKIGNAKWGVYAFHDYDGEPTYVGQTNEMLRSRISRHLTNQRADAVAMNVLDPFEAADIDVWPFGELQNKKGGDADVKPIRNSAEYTVFQYVLKKSSFGAVLFDQRKHPDVRLARRATTIAALARVITERSVSKGLRRTLMTQAARFQSLATQRHDEIGRAVPAVDPGEEV